MSYFGLWGFEHMAAETYPQNDAARITALKSTAPCTILAGDLSTMFFTDRLGAQHLYVSPETNRHGNLSLNKLADGAMYLRHNYNNGGSGLRYDTHSKFAFVVYRPTGNVYTVTDTSVLSFGIRLDRTASRATNWLQLDGLVHVTTPTGSVWNAGTITYPNKGYLEVTIDFTAKVVSVWIDNALIATYSDFDPATQSVVVYDRATLDGREYSDYSVQNIGPRYLKVSESSDPEPGRLGPIKCALVPLEPATGDWSDTTKTGEQLSAFVSTPIQYSNHNAAASTTPTAAREKPVHFTAQLPAGTAGMSAVAISNRASDANLLEEFFLDINATSLSAKTEVVVTPAVQFNSIGQLIPEGASIAKFSIRSLRKPN